MDGLEIYFPSHSKFCFGIIIAPAAAAIFIPAVRVNGQAGGHKLERMVRPENASDYLAQPCSG